MNEITSPVALADERGRLVPGAVGWARHPIVDCRLPPRTSRVGTWSYWGITSNTHALTILLADVGVFGGALVSFVELSDGAPVERLYLRPRGLPMAIGDGPQENFSLDVSRLRLSLEHHGDVLAIRGSATPLFGRRIDVTLDVLRPVAHETINLVVPWDAERYHFTSKQQALPTRGTVTIDGRAHTFGPENQGFACLDYGRTRWPTHIDWQWAFASTKLGTRTLGFNFGATWTEGTGVNENGFVLDGRVHKLFEDVDFAFDRGDYLRPWRLRTRHSDRVDLTFTPVRLRVAAGPLGLVASLHQLLGHFSGTLLTDEDERLDLAGVVGLCENVHGRWSRG